MKITPCFVDKKNPALCRVKIRGKSNAIPRSLRPLCAEHAAQAAAAGYKTWDLPYEEEENE
jgi:hypothetical protein